VTVADVRAALALGDAGYAFAVLRGMLDDAERAGRDALAEWLELLERAGGALAGAGFAEVVRGAALDPDNAAAVSALGERLLVDGLPRMAITLLARAQRIAPADEAILAALVSALAADGQHARACAALRDAPAPGGASLSRRGVQARHAVLAGELDGARQCVPELLASPEPAHQELARVIGGMLARADAIAGVSALDAGDLRGWHFVVTGGLLLHVAEHGRTAGMNGRYGFVHDSYESCREGLARLAAVLARLPGTGPGERVERVLAPTDRASAILGRAAARVLDCPVVDWPDGDPSAAGLVVAYDLDAVPPAAREALRVHRGDQRLYCQAAGWTREPVFAADLVMRLHQFSLAPWDGHVGFDPRTAASREVAPDDGDAAALAARIAGAACDPAALADLPSLLALVDAARTVEGDAAAGVRRSGGPRRRAWCGSPVPSLRFDEHA
jgi:hypothetical protein